MKIFCFLIFQICRSNSDASEDNIGIGSVVILNEDKTYDTEDFEDLEVGLFELYLNQHSKSLKGQKDDNV